MKLDFVLDRTEQYLRILQSSIIQPPRELILFLITREETRNRQRSL